MKAILAGFLLAILGTAQQVVWIDLAGSWRASGATGESEVRLPLHDRLDPSIRSLRRSVELPQERRDRLALTVGGIAESYEVFVNGARIGQVGLPGHEQLARPRTFDLPANLETPRLDIEIRIRQFRARGSIGWRLQDDGPWLLTSARAAPGDAGELAIARRQALRSGDLSQPLVMFCLAAFSLLFWWSNRDRPAALWLGLLLACVAASRWWIYSAIREDSEPFASVHKFDVVRYLIPFGLFGHLACSLLAAPRWILIPVWTLLLIGGLWPVTGISLVGFDIASGVFVLLGIGLGLRRQSPRRPWLTAGLALTVCVSWLAFSQALGLTIADETLVFGFRFSKSVAMLLVLGISITFGLVRELLRDREDKFRLESDLEAARTVQSLLLPAAGGTEGVETVYAPAQVVGGDFYAVETLADGALLVVAGDVSGKGLKAAMVVSMLIGAFRNRRGDHPAALLAELNQVLRGQLDGGFVTCGAVRLAPDGRGTVSNAGHLAPYLAGTELALDQGLPLGVIDAVDYAETQFALERGQQLTLVSDGVVEAANADGELFGFDRTREISGESAAEIAEAAKAWGQNGRHHGGHGAEANMRRLLVVLVLGLPMLAQAPALSIDLSGDWRIRKEDRPEFSQQDFDDSGWELQRLPLESLPFDLSRSGEARPLGYWWLRRTVELPEWADVSQLALTLGGMNEVYEVFVNGRRIASVGERRLSKTYIARPRTFAIPALTSRRLTIALRHWRSGFSSSAVRGVPGFPDTGPYRLTYQSDAPVDATAKEMAKRERRATSLLIVSEFAIVLSVLLLLGWLIQRDRKDLALLAGFLLAQALLKLYDYASIVADWPHSTNNLGALGLTLTPLFLARFSELALGIRTRWLSRAAWVPFLWHALSNVMVLWTDGNLTLPLGFISITASMSLILLAIFLVAVNELRRVVQQSRWRDALAPLTIAVIAFLLTQSGNAPWRVLRIAFDSYGMRWQLVDILIVAAGLSMTVQLIRGLGAAQQRLAGEMEAARAVQQLLLADNTSPSDSAYRIETAYMPAQEVGGDFYKVLDRADGSQVIVVGDVSGKGLPAAMLVSEVIGALGRETSCSPAAILAGLNEAINGHTGGGFVTCCAVRLVSDEVIIANAGHIPPYLNGLEVEIEPGLPLGMVREVSYAEVTFNVTGQLSLVSDGVVEAADVKGDLFGFDRTRDISGESASEIADAAQAWGQNDDITVVTVRRRV